MIPDISYDKMKLNYNYISSIHFLMKLHDFDYSLLDIPFNVLLDDYGLEKNEQKYSNWNNSGKHLLLYIIRHNNNLDLVIHTINELIKYNNHNLDHIPFKHILDKMPIKFIEEVNKKLIIPCLK